MAIARDVTKYARSLGYSDMKPVIVADGRVISHRNRCWFRFCDLIRAQNQKR